MRKRTGSFFALFLSFLLAFQQSGFAQIAAELNIASHLFGTGNPASASAQSFRPIHLRYLGYDTAEGVFSLLMDKGDESVSSEEADKLMEYFFTGLSLPADTFWVNLRPDSPQNMIDPSLENTQLGKVMLEADVMLKRDTASYTNPQTKEGRQYWQRLYKKAEELFGTDEVTIPTLIRPWIVPDEVIIGDYAGSAYVYKATLKVLLEDDYLKQPQAIAGGSQDYSFSDQRLKALNEYSAELLRELVIPKLNKEVNSSRRYAPLRQVYYSLIIAQWFKANHSPQEVSAASLTGKKLSYSRQPWDKEEYFKQYKSSFEFGEYNIREPLYGTGAEKIRSYMSGGISFGQGLADSMHTLNGVRAPPFGLSPSLVPAQYSDSGAQFSREGEAVSSPVSAQSPGKGPIRGDDTQKMENLYTVPDNPVEFIDYLKANTVRYDHYAVWLAQEFIKNKSRPVEAVGRIDLGRLNMLINYIAAARDTGNIPVHIARLVDYLELVRQIKTEQSIEITGYVPYLNINEVRNIVRWFPARISNQMRIPIELTFAELLSMNRAGEAGLQTMAGIKIDNDYRLNPQVIYHELTHKVSFSGNKNGEPIIPGAVWKKVAKASGFVGFFMGRQFINVEEMSDDYRLFRDTAARYGDWVLREDDGTLSCYVTRADDYERLSAQRRATTEGIVPNVRIYRSGEYWKTTPLEAVAEAGAYYVEDSRMSGQPQRLKDVARILSLVLFSTDYENNGVFYKYVFDGYNRRKTAEPLTEVEQKTREWYYESIIERLLPDTEVVVRKLMVRPGESSRVSADSIFKGFLDRKVLAGGSIVLKDDRGAQILSTSKVRQVMDYGDKARVVTGTSVYEVEVLSGFSPGQVLRGRVVASSAIDSEVNVPGELTVTLQDSSRRMIEVPRAHARVLSALQQISRELKSKYPAQEIDEAMNSIGFAGGFVRSIWSSSENLSDLDIILMSRSKYHTLIKKMLREKTGLTIDEIDAEDDFSGFLELRDFTINKAVMVLGDGSSARVIDPAGEAIKALDDKVLRLTHEEVPDMKRALRAARFMAEGFGIDPHAEELLTQAYREWAAEANQWARKGVRGHLLYNGYVIAFNYEHLKQSIDRALEKGGPRARMAYDRASSLFSVDKFINYMEKAKDSFSEPVYAASVESDAVSQEQDNFTKSRPIAEYIRMLRDARTGFDIAAFIRARLKQAAVRYLDAGCGTGIAAKQVSAIKGEHEVRSYGLDLVDWMAQPGRMEKELEMARKLYSQRSWEEFSGRFEELLRSTDFRFIQDSAEQAVLPEEMDLITSFFVLQYSNNPLQAWNNLYNQLAPDGEMILHLLITPQAQDVLYFYMGFVDNLREAGIDAGINIFRESESKLHLIIRSRRLEGQNAEVNFPQDPEVESVMIAGGESVDRFSINLVRYPSIEVTVRQAGAENTKFSMGSSPLASSANENPQAAASSGNRLGGIDLRSIPIVTLPVFNISAYGRQGLKSFSGFDYDRSWSEIAGMLYSDILPSVDRIEEYILACLSADSSVEHELDRAALCIAEVFRMEEQNYVATEPRLYGMLALLESGRNSNEMLSVIAGTEPMAAE